MVHAALLLLMLEAVTRTSFHHQPEAQHPKSSAIHKNAGRLPHLWVDIVAKRFLVPERGIIFQERVRMVNIDSRIPSFGFCYCLLQRVDGSLADFCNTIGQRRSYSDHKRTHALQNER